MALAPGARLGPYEILSPLGAGGMGEVYRAKDPRLGREVAVKVVRPRLAADPEQLRRFEQEARAAAQVEHPNLLVVHDVAVHEGCPYIVSELLEGETLRERLGVPLPPRRAAEYAVQVARGLAAAHEKGIVHRDVKPENLFVTKDGRVKILDFGLAKLTQPGIPSVSLTEAPTAAPATDPGIVVGTVAYMSPEQVLGRPVDGRSDLFSLGLVLYEMLTGKRPFQKETAPETMAAILREELPELSGTGSPVPLGLDRIVRHCLEKEPTSRFQSARDVAFALESLSQETTAGTAPIAAKARWRRTTIAALGSLLLAACAAGFFLLGKGTARAPVPSFQRITLRRGMVGSARFAPDLQSVVYCASWEGREKEVFVQRLASPDARPLGVTSACVVGTAGGNVAVVRDGGTLAQLPLEGGTPRDLVANVADAAWDRDGRGFVVVRGTGIRFQLEYPPGKVLLETTEMEHGDSPRLSPDGTRIAFALHPSRADASGDLCVLDTSGRKVTLSRGWSALGGAAWSPDGSEIWFSATKGGVNDEVHAVTLSGKERLVARLPGSLRVQDIAPDGRLLATFGQAPRFEMRGRMAGDQAERDLSWLDGTSMPVLAPDGTQMVFQEWGAGGGEGGSTFHRVISGGAPKRLGEGMPLDVSPDWKTALVFAGLGERMEARLVPLGAGETVSLPRGPVHTLLGGCFHPDGKRVVLLGADGNGQRTLYVQRLDGGEPRPLVPAARGFGGVSPDGRYILAKIQKDAPYVLQPFDGGAAQPVPFLTPEDGLGAFGEDGGSLYLVPRNALGGPFPVRVVRLDLRTGQRSPWLELDPPDRSGIRAYFGSALAPNGRSYAYTYQRQLSDLYLVEGLR